MKKTLTMLMLIIITCNVSSQTLDWAKQFGYGFNDYPIDINVDSAKNIYTAFQVSNSVSVIGGNFNGFVRLNKLDPNGNILWELNMPHIYKTSTDTAGNVYVTGKDFNGTYDYDPGTETAFVTPMPGYDTLTFIVKYNTNGEFKWLRSFYVGNSEYLINKGFLECNSDGEIYVAGTFIGFIKIDFGATPFEFSAQNLVKNLFTIKIDSTGNLLWHHQSDSLYHYDVYKMKLDNQSNIYFTGYQNGDWYGHHFAQKLNSNGEFVWDITFPFVVNFKVSNDGDIYFFGRDFVTDYPTDLNPGPGEFNMSNLGCGNEDYFVVKLNQNADFIWAKCLKNSPINLPQTYILSIDLDENENFYITGTGGRVDYDMNEGIYVAGNTLTSFYIAKYDSLANFYWVKHFEDPTNNSNEYLTSFSSAGKKLIISGKNIYTTGYFYNPIDLDPQDSQFIFTPINTTSTSVYDSCDVFVQKISLGPCDNLRLDFSEIENITCDSLGSATANLSQANGPIEYEWNTNPIVTENSFETISPGIYSVTTTNNECTLSSSIFINGPVFQNNIDNQVSISGGFFRPTFPAFIVLNAFNNGCVPSDVNIRFVIDSLCSFSASNPSPSSISGDTLSWTLSSFSYDDASFEIQIELETDISANIGDTVKLYADISPTTDDINLVNNFQTSFYPVVNSYDPNMKEFYPLGKCDNHYVLSNEKLTTTIHFQNTGNAEAINVYILDTLDVSLDLQSVRVLNFSHPFVLEIIEGNVLKFLFNNIMLADSTSNEELSKGYITYEVNQKQDILPNTLINHKAAQIYFDLNLPILTNEGFHTSVTSIPICTSGINEVNNSYQIYPNPASHYCDIFSTLKGKTEIQILNSTGEIVFYDNKEINTGAANRIFLPELSSGIYFIKVINSEGVHLNKLIISK